MLTKLSTLSIFIFSITIGYSQGFQTTWKTDNVGTSASDQVTIPTFSGETYDYTVDWGDGNVDPNTTGDITHTYTVAGTYTIEITGDFPRIYFNNAGDKLKLLTIENWGDSTWTNMDNSFYGCENLAVNAIDAPVFDSNMSCQSMFAGCINLTGDFSSWNTVNVINMSAMFFDATNFNEDISGWDVSNVTNMSYLFSGLSSFNQDITGWDVSSVTNTSNMLEDCSSFNQDIGIWNVSSVTNMSYMLYNCSIFNYNIGNWNTDVVTNMRYMLGGCLQFNQDIGNWNVSSVTDMSNMFYNADAFNQDIGTWDVSSATTMVGMFWYCDIFNQDLNAWSPINVTNMERMFDGAAAFNQDISGWDVSNVTNMNQMFYYANAFNQDLSSWQITAVTDMTNILEGTSLSTANYDSMLDTWSGLTLQTGVNFGAGTATYCASEAERQSIIDNFSWTITDGGGGPEDAGFSYSLNQYCNDDVDQTPVITGLPNGDFTFTPAGADVVDSTGIIKLALSTPGTYNITYTTTGTCPGDSTVTVSIGEPNSSTDVQTACGEYTWMDGITYTASNNTATKNFSNITGCDSVVTLDLTIYDLPNIALTSINTSCNSPSGSVSSAISGGQPPYSVYWSNGATTNDITDLAASAYYINVTDGNNCYAMDVATVASTDITLSGTSTDLQCYGDSNGAIDLTVTGSTGPYIYYWSNGKSTQDINNLVAGQYEVFVTDANGCTSSKSFDVLQPNTITSQITTSNPTYCGATDGDLTAAILGGTAPFNVEWLDETGSPIGTGLTLSTLPAGLYDVTITDDNGCLHYTHGQLSELGGPEVSLNSVSIASCDEDGAIDVNINAPVSIQTYSWSNGETTEDLTDLAHGYYTLTVTDINSCVGNFGVNVEPVYPGVNDICLVTVDTSTNTNLIIWEKPISTEIDYFIMYRETSVAGQFLPVDTIQYEDESAFTDPIAYPQLRSWRYKMTTVNQCGIESDFSPVHKTIHITISQGLGDTFNVNWDSYEGFSYSTFDLYRLTDEDNDWVLIQSLPSTNFSYTDTPPSEEGLDYMISITPPSICSATKAQDHNASRSNKSSSVTNNPGQPEEEEPNTNGINESTFAQGISIYPNPSNSLFNVFLNAKISETFQVNIYDMKGAIVKTFSSNKSGFQVELNGFDAGMYILEIATSTEVVRKQLIKQ